MKHFLRTCVLFFANPLQTCPCAQWWKEWKGRLPLAVGHNGPVFDDVFKNRHDFADAESVRGTRHAGGQVLGQLF